MPTCAFSNSAITNYKFVFAHFTSCKQKSRLGENHLKIKPIFVISVEQPEDEIDFFFFFSIKLQFVLIQYPYPTHKHAFNYRHRVVSVHLCAHFSTVLAFYIKGNFFSTLQTYLQLVYNVTPFTFGRHNLVYWSFQRITHHKLHGKQHDKFMISECL